ncbi:MAG: DUF2339 domain-containing protein [Burkholderiales bacterium]|nr:DUF2339 domain-containing protein [Burkholderiales bacterium]
MIALAIGIGFIFGALVLGWSGAIAGAFIGFIVAMVWRSRTQARERMQHGVAAPGASLQKPALARDDARAATDGDPRLADIERRLAALERMAGIAQSPEVPPSDAAAIETPDSMATSSAAAPVASTSPNAVPAIAAPGASATATPARRNSPLGWFTGGNVLTRVGVVALFFGVAFLLRYFAEVFTVPIAVKLSGVALTGIALIALGMRLGRKRPAYGLSLQGAGAGILYLTTFAAFRLYEVLPAVPAFALLVAAAGLTVWLAIRNDSQPLAGLAVAGGFLAPFLVATSAGAPALLFGYFAVLNGAIFALAWLRAWRTLNALGFVFTFVLGVFWGERYYRPEHFATVQPFLVLFFVFYVTIAVLYAKRGALEAKTPVDAMLVFGVPLVAFALQAGLVRDTRYGVAWSALAMAATYGVLAAALIRRPQEAQVLLARAFLVLAFLFATIAIPFAVDPQWTSAWWALEAAGVYWIGCVQRQWLARGFALLLQLGAAFAFVAGGTEAGDRMFVNATYMGSAMIALAALATAFNADRHRDALTASERAVVPFVLLWGIVWWYGAGALDLARALPTRTEGNAILMYATSSAAVALLLQRWLRWPRLVWFGAAVLPVMAWVAFADWDAMRTTLRAYGWVVWPLAWVAHWAVLRAADALRAEGDGAGRGAARIGEVLKVAHAASAIAAVAWVAWEASEWVGRKFPEGTIWMACAAAWPAIAYLALVVRNAHPRTWPLSVYRDAYATSAGTAIGALLGVWFAIVNVISPGSTAPLPFVPIVNPLDLTLVAALAVLFRWAQHTTRATDRALYAWFGAALFLLINAIAFRTVHQWMDVPWRLPPLLAYKPLQATLTLAWTATALPLMLVATRRAVRPLWMVGAALLGAVVVKLFVVDLSALSGLPRVVAFLGVGALLLLIGYLAPLPPAAARSDELPPQ